MKLAVSKAFIAAKRRRSVSSTPKERDRSNRIYMAANAVFTFGLLVAALAQCRASERQADTAEALRKLEFARSAARFNFEPSAQVITFGTAADPSAVTLPRHITVTPVNGVSAVALMDVQVELSVARVPDGPSCDLFVRGLYLDDKRALNFMPEMESAFRKLVSGLSQQGLSAQTTSYTVTVRYTDLFGDLVSKDYRLGLNDPMEARPTSFSNPILYSGIWSGGNGFYFDSLGDPQIHCPPYAKQIRGAVLATGGVPPKLP